MNVEEAIKKRRSFRALERIEITDEIIDKLSNSVSLTPSCYNKQPWRFIFITESDLLLKFQDTISEGNRSWTANASMMVVAFTKNDLDCQIPKKEPTIEYAEFDTGLACAFLILQATELDLVAHPMAGFNPDKVKEILKIPSDFKVVCCIAIGKKSNDISSLSGFRLDTELERPNRKPLKEIIFYDEFDKAIE